MKKLVNGVTVDMTLQEIAVFNEPLPTAELAKLVRETRNLRLSETDWMANSDVTMATEWRTYRQSLRDVPLQIGFPNSITWPTEPS
tara:strand:- start:507 stop:764 length:258 start_codon:yes stop_codon:yes gene_type:complete